MASTAAFYVLTRSGLAGTLAGAAVASMVYTGTAHWAGAGVERLVAWSRALANRRQAPNEIAGSDRGLDDAPDGLAGGGPDDERATEPSRSADPQAGQLAVETTAPRAGRRSLVARWAPFVLAGAALGTSAYSMISGTPIERVIVQERVVEKPIVQERVVVQKETVTVTVPVYVPATDQAGNVGSPVSTTSTTDGASSTTTTTDPQSTSSTSTTTTTEVPASTTTTLPPSTVSTAPSPTG